MVVVVCVLGLKLKLGDKGLNCMGVRLHINGEGYLHSLGLGLGLGLELHSIEELHSLGELHSIGLIGLIGEMLHSNRFDVWVGLGGECSRVGGV